MTTRRKHSKGDPRKHPGNDTLSVVWPDPDAMLADLPAQIRTDEVTRDEFTRRMAGCPDALSTLHESGRNTRVIMLADPDLIIHWWKTAP